LCAIDQSSTEVDNRAMAAGTTAIDTDDEYNVVAQPKTKKGNAIVWQCEVYEAGEDDTGTGSHWADYAANYNMMLEAAYEAMQPFVRITGPENVPGGFWDFNLETLIQKNSDTEVERRMRRVVVTLPGA
jgi:hypothetical protein